MSEKALVALVGRPNVGKSTLFNRIVGRRIAVVSDIAGTTRDRLYADSEWNGIPFMLVDTGGIELVEGWNTVPLSEDSSRFMPLIRQQATIAIQDADVIIHVVDGRAGITSADKEIADILRRSKKPIIIAANKLESSKLWDDAYEFYELALGEVFPISALHGAGSGDLLDAVTAVIPEFPAEDEDENNINIALIGRPNTGKSTLLNKLVGEERAIVSPIAGTTRDATDTKLMWGDQPFTIIDTAGIRKRGKIERGVEKYSVLRALKALQRADVALLLLEASEGVTAQDAHIAGMLLEDMPAVVILVNKWDAVEKDGFTIYDHEEALRQELNFLPFAPIMFISAKTGQRTQKIFSLVLKANEARHRRIKTAALNKFMRDTVAKNPPSGGGGKRVKFFYATQASTAPPTFIFFVNKPKFVHFSYKRYLENQLRENFDLAGTPIRLLFRARSEDRFGK